MILVPALLRGKAFATQCRGCISSICSSIILYYIALMTTCRTNVMFMQKKLRISSQSKPTFLYSTLFRNKARNLTKGHALTTTKSGWLTSVFTLMGPPRALESKPILELVLPRKSGDLGRIFVGGRARFWWVFCFKHEKVAVSWDFLGNTKMGFNSIWLSKSLWIVCVVCKSHLFSKWILWYQILLVKVFWTLYTPVCGEAHKQQRWCFW